MIAMPLGEVFTQKPENAVVVNLEQLWKSISGDVALIEHIPAYKARLEQISQELSSRPGVEIVLFGRAPIWLYVIAFHEFHWASRVYVYDPKAGYIVVAEHAPTRKPIKFEAPKKVVELLNVNVVGTLLEHILLKLSEILESQKEMYKKYLELKEEQVKLLKQTARHEFD